LTNPVYSSPQDKFFNCHLQETIDIMLYYTEVKYLTSVSDMKSTDKKVIYFFFFETSIFLEKNGCYQVGNFYFMRWKITPETTRNSEHFKS